MEHILFFCELMEHILYCSTVSDRKTRLVHRKPLLWLLVPMHGTNCNRRSLPGKQGQHHMAATHNIENNTFMLLG